MAEVLDVHKNLFNSQSLLRQMEQLVQSMHKTFVSLPDLHPDKNLKDIEGADDVDCHRSKSSKKGLSNMEETMTAEEYERYELIFQRHCFEENLCRL